MKDGEWAGYACTVGTFVIICLLGWLMSFGEPSGPCVKRIPYSITRKRVVPTVFSDTRFQFCWAGETQDTRQPCNDICEYVPESVYTKGTN